MGEATFWFTLVLVIVILMIPVVAWRFYFVDVSPTLSDRVRLKQRLSAIRAHKSQDFMRTPSARRSRRSLRSGYAFAHQEGFGKLITSGKIMRKTGLNFVKSSSNLIGGIGGGGGGGNNNSSSSTARTPTRDQADGPVSGLSYNQISESNGSGSMQPSTRQSYNGRASAPPATSFPIATATVKVNAATNSNRTRLEDPYAITIDPNSDKNALPNSLST
jgi:hypothetical protein